MGSVHRREVKNLLSVLASAVICACLLAIFFIYYYSPSGRYLAGHTLLDPLVIDTLQDQQKLNYLFDHFELSHFDTSTGKVLQKTISNESYKKIYDLIASDKSLLNPSPQAPLFRGSHPTLLKIYVIDQKNRRETVQSLFQIVQFLPEDYYRVQLREGKDLGEWAYFYHPHLYPEILKLL